MNTPFTIRSNGRSIFGGWNQDATAHAADEVQLMLQGLVKEYVEQCEIHALSSTDIVSNLNKRSVLIQEKFGVELISLAVDSLEPTDPEISEALRQQEQARLFLLPALLWNATVFQ